MLDQAVHVNSQVAFMFVLALASVNLASANPFCTECANNRTSDSASKTVVDHNVQTKESGEQHNQTIEEDTEKQTELFKGPAHGNVDHSNILHDFKKISLVTSKKAKTGNVSLLLLPEKKTFYLLPLDKELPTPRKLLSDLEKAEKSYKNISDTSVTEYKWTVGSEGTDRSVLSDELGNFCAKYPIYNVNKMELKETLKTTKIQTGGERHIKTFKI